MRQHEENAIKISSYLRAHKKIKKVYYPGFEDHPQHALAKSQMSGFGGMISFEIEGDETAAKAFIDNIELFSLSISFGSVASLIAYPAKMSLKDMPREERIKRGFPDSLLRLSVGIEKDTDLIADIEQALSKS